MMLFFTDEMGFFDKLKNFGSKIVTGVRKGWDFVKNKVAPVVRKAIPVAKGVAQFIPGASPVVDKVANIADKGLSLIGR